MANHSSIFAREFHGQRSLVGSPWDRKELDTTDQLSLSSFILGRIIYSRSFLFLFLLKNWTFIVVSFIFFKFLSVMGFCCSIWASVIAACRLHCPMACGILVFRPGIKTASSALGVSLLTIGPPGKPLTISLKLISL